MCSSMPAMASFSRLHVSQQGYFPSLRSWLFPRSASRASQSFDAPSYIGSKRGAVSKTSADPPSGSHFFTRLHHPRDVELSDSRYIDERVRTSIRGAVTQGNCETVGIQKSVSVQQSWDWYPSTERQPSSQEASAQ